MGILESKPEESFWDSESLNSPDDNDLDKYDYPFENLVFEGGGVKTISYHGTLKVLKRVGIFKKVKRFSGASIGSVLAALLAVGYDPDEVVPMMSKERDSYLEDHACAVFSLVPNIIKDYGWNPGKKMLSWMGDKLEEKTGKRNLTFKEAYMMYGTELCVVVTNVNQMDVEYCHIKTTPDLPIRWAIRMSTAIPGFYEPVKYPNGKNIDMYVDGGLLVNYPVHCFDGWWLSMKPEDGFLKKLSELQKTKELKRSRFNEFNARTLGVLIYSKENCDIGEQKLADRDADFLGDEIPDLPTTTITQDRRERIQHQRLIESQYNNTAKALEEFLKVLRRIDFDEDNTIDREALEDALDKSTNFTGKLGRALFGPHYAADLVFETIDRNHDGKINSFELMYFAETRGLGLGSQFSGYSRRKIESIGDYISTLEATLLTQIKKLYYKERDLDRSIGINLDYLEDTDTQLEAGDKLFAAQQGAKATRAYLRFYVKKFSPPLKWMEATQFEQATVEDVQVQEQS
ncbi:uncharacterized protein LOC144432681 [Glandiceps talaboti]